MGHPNQGKEKNRDSVVTRLALDMHTDSHLPPMYIHEGIEHGWIFDNGGARDNTLARLGDASRP